MQFDSHALNIDDYDNDDLAEEDWDDADWDLADSLDSLSSK